MGGTNPDGNTGSETAKFLPGSKKRAKVSGISSESFVKSISLDPASNRRAR
jgi:hypothetical protein